MKRILAHASEKATEVFYAVGVKKGIVTPPGNIAHLMGTARIGNNEKNSVLDEI